MNKITFTERLGHGGPLTVSDKGLHWPVSDLFIEASEELGIKRNPSYNSGDNQGENASVMAVNVTATQSFRCCTTHFLLRVIDIIF